MPIFATAGSKVFIGTALAATAVDFVAADFTAQTWTQIGSLESIGSLGDTSSEITFDDIGKGRTQKAKGPRNAGTMELVAAIDYADPGQIALIAAEKLPHSFAFKIEFNDKPATGASPKNSQRLFTAKIMSASEALDNAGSIMKMSASLSIDSNIVRVNASAT